MSASPKRQMTKAQHKTLADIRSRLEYRRKKRRFNERAGIGSPSERTNRIPSAIEDVESLLRIVDQILKPD